MLLDDYAWNNALRRWHPLERLSITAGGMLVTLISHRPAVAFSVFLVFSALIVGAARVKLKDFLYMLSWPVAFLAIGIIAIVISYNPGIPCVLSVKTFGLTWGITWEGVQTAHQLSARVLSMVSAMYFLCLTTPIVELTSVLKTLRMPDIISDIMYIMYRGIYLLSETVEQTVWAQTLRLGYSDWKHSFSSFSYLVTFAWVDAIHRSRENTTAMLVRGLNCTLPDLAVFPKLSPARLLLVCFVSATAIVIAVMV
ncbi:MAG: cobalt ECF transporter T component CbiQ [Syntrophothermus sp.]|uniref:cobalt ECF transporter T component CbiQ n=1 Tax=Syntrophothermus sp. TaxID=2736299 RepID=UPI00257C2316|nr:cobalt ECF transporter T component CbiQ [Syntrophothermus sp.]NSW82383.1 cobalt ECF transporter T component CbiQ [Syntrophothermus sp.]